MLLALLVVAATATNTYGSVVNIEKDPNNVLFLKRGRLIDGVAHAHLLLVIDLAEDEKFLAKTKKAIQKFAEHGHTANTAAAVTKDIEWRIAQLKTWQGLIPKEKRARRQAVAAGVVLLGLAGYAALEAAERFYILKQLENTDTHVSRMSHTLHAAMSHEEGVNTALQDILGIDAAHIRKADENELRDSVENAVSRILRREDLRLTALNRLFQGTLEVGLVEDKALRRAYKKLGQKLDRQGMELVYDDPARLYRYPTFAIFQQEDARIKILMSVETVTKGGANIWTLYHHVAVPWIINNRSVLVEGHKNLLAMNTAKDAFLELSSADLMQCQAQGRDTVCRMSHPRLLGSQSGCLPAIFHRSPEAIRTHCQQTPVTGLYVKRVNETSFIHSDMKTTAATVACKNLTLPLTLINTNLIRLEDGCTFSSTRTIVAGAISGTSLPTVTLEMPRPKEDLYKESDLDRRRR